MNQTTHEVPDIRQIEPNAFKVRSASHPTTSHTVRLAYRKWWCSCPATVAECRRIRRAKEMLTMGHTAPVPVVDPDDDYRDADFPWAAAPEIGICDHCDDREVIAGTTPRGDRLCATCFDHVDPSHPDAVRAEASPASLAVQPVCFSTLWSDGKVPSPMSYREVA